MKHLYAWLIIIFPTVLNAQNFSISPSKVYTQNLGYGAITYDGVYLNNLTSSDLYLSWQLISVDAVPGCEFHMCASGICYTGIPIMGDFPVIDPSGGNPGFLFMHSFTDSTPGINKIKIRVFDIADTSSADTVTLIVNVSDPNGIMETDYNEINIYPNPATEKIYISQGSNNIISWELFDIVGNKLRAQSEGKNNEIPLLDFSKGIYFLKVTNEKNEVIIRKFYKL